MASKRRYGGASASERQATRRQQLLDAGLKLLGTEGFNSTTVRAVCATAKLTPRYFYESFPDLDALLVAVFDEIADQLAAEILRAVTPPPGDARQTARAAIAAGVSTLTGDPRKARVLFVEALGSEALAERRRQTLRGFAALVAAQGRSFYGVPGTEDRLVELSALMLVGGLSEAFAAWFDGGVHATADELVDDCTELFLAAGSAAARLAGKPRTADPRADLGCA
jgi:AcrR family transcriptional regulator